MSTANIKRFSGVSDNVVFVKNCTGKTVSGTSELGALAIAFDPSVRAFDLLAGTRPTTTAKTRTTTRALERAWFYARIFTRGVPARRWPPAS